MFRSAKSAAAKEVAASAHPPLAASVLAGGAIGFIAGLTGIGGGVFIAPFVLTFGWLGMRQTAGLSALFNLLNSAAAFAGVWAASPTFPPNLQWWLVAAAASAVFGASLGTNYLTPSFLRYLLAALLLTGGLRMLWAW